MGMLDTFFAGRSSIGDLDLDNSILVLTSWRSHAGFLINSSGTVSAFLINEFRTAPNDHPSCEQIGRTKLTFVRSNGSSGEDSNRRQCSRHNWNNFVVHPAAASDMEEL